MILIVLWIISVAAKENPTEEERAARRTLQQPIPREAWSRDQAEKIANREQI